MPTPVFLMDHIRSRSPQISSKMSTPVSAEQCNVVCPSCRRQILTKIEHRSTTKTHLIALILCIIGCWPCAGCLYCTGCARNVEHYCPSCNAFIGVYEK